MAKITTRPWDPERKPPTERQRAAWTAFRLRGLWHQCWLIKPPLRAAAWAIIDAELERLGFETEGDRYGRRFAKPVRGDEDIETEEDLPF